MGANDNIIRAIFLKEGFLISTTGVSIGLFIGGVICYLQQTFGLVSMGMQSAIQNAYPVQLNSMDFVFIAVTVLIVTFLVSYRPARIAVKYASLDNI